MLNPPAVFLGKVRHKRFFPKIHEFLLPFGCYFIPLVGDEYKINQTLIKHGIKGNFQRRHYLGEKKDLLQNSVLEKASQLAGKNVTGDVFFLGQLSQWGFYFSSVNFYFIGDNKQFKKLLAEVTNTPWGERHCYLIDLTKENSHKKEFHVSPFNPMDMTYKWTVKATFEKIYLRIDCFKEILHFNADIDLQIAKTKSNHFLMPLRMLIHIYLNALVLFFKKIPYYPHPKASK